jgi:hypothetical protein
MILFQLDFLYSFKAPGVEVAEVITVLEVKLAPVVAAEDFDLE